MQCIEALAKLTTNAGIEIENRHNRLFLRVVCNPIAFS